MAYLLPSIDWYGGADRYHCRTLSLSENEEKGFSPIDRAFECLYIRHEMNGDEFFVFLFIKMQSVGQVIN